MLIAGICAVWMYLTGFGQTINTPIPATSPIPSAGQSVATVVNMVSKQIIIDVGSRGVKTGDQIVLIQETNSLPILVAAGKIVRTYKNDSEAVLFDTWGGSQIVECTAWVVNRSNSPYSLTRYVPSGGPAEKGSVQTEFLDPPSDTPIPMVTFMSGSFVIINRGEAGLKRQDNVAFVARTKLGPVLLGTGSLYRVYREDSEGCVDHSSGTRVFPTSEVYVISRGNSIYSLSKAMLN